eukprot:gnl/MRDRNA2_/MRDRNA2_43470_c0_seq1.p1 gnl/MRDRNA2_/MRDRNA2_43470_c0~~gnl/MRDRNA2_/MRDRNA2_43470_c0_seq1.p1  ORF type:complete len:338 (+),score=47.45 gnl/MRDRNA2_/MRDRNA2_43470_c0_seq1:112-1125(+)
MLGESPHWQSQQLLLPSGHAPYVMQVETCHRNAEAPHWHSHRLLLPEVSDSMHSQITRVARPFAADMRSLSPQQPSYHGTVPSAAAPSAADKKTFSQMQPQEGLDGAKVSTFNASQLFRVSDTMHAQISRIPTPLRADRRSASPARQNPFSGSMNASMAAINKPYTSGFSWDGGPSAPDVKPVLKKSSMSECSTQVPSSTSGESETLISSSLIASRQSLSSGKSSHHRSTSTGASPSVSWVSTSSGASQTRAPRKRGRAKSPRPSGGIRPHEIKKNWESSLCGAKWSEKGGIKVETIAQRSSSVPVTGAQKRVTVKAVPQGEVEQRFLSSLRPGMNE